MASGISKEKIDELVNLAKSQKLVPEDKLCFDGTNGDYSDEQYQATYSFMLLRKMGIHIDVEYDD